MENFVCKSCGSIDLLIKEKGTQTGLYCRDCGKWIKWLSKDEKFLAAKFIAANFITENTKPTEQNINNNYVVRKAFDTIRMHINQEYNSKTSIVISADGTVRVFEEI